jgi:quinol monooxygenase YgiN
VTDGHHCVIAHTRVLPGLIDDLIELFHSAIEAALQQEGCIRYELWQDPVNPRHFTVIQEWETQAALDAYLASPLVNAVGYRLGDLVEGPPMVVRFRRVI